MKTATPDAEGATKPAEGPSSRGLSVRAVFRYRESGVFLALAVFCGVLSLVLPPFRDPYNLLVMGKQLSTLAIIAAGQTLVVISGAFDLSQSAICGLAAMTAGIWAQAGFPPGIAILIALVVSVIAGWLNGTLAARLNLHPIVMTLATGTIFVGITYVISLGQPAIGLPNSLLMFGASSIGWLPVPVLIMLVIVAGMQVMLSRTLFGLHVRQLGGNREAARLSGTNVRRVWLGVFVISALTAGIGGVVELGRVGAAIPTIGATLLFPIITATILGGTLLTGGEGSIVGTMLGAAILIVINDALVVGEVSIYWQNVVQGALVVVALVIDQFRRGKLTFRDLIRPAQ